MREEIRKDIRMGLQQRMAAEKEHKAYSGFGRRQKAVAILVSMILLGGLSLTILPAHAKQRMKSLKAPIMAQMVTAVDGKTAQEGDPFKAVLTEAYLYDHKTLPAGTTFEGQVVKTSESRHVMRPGYVVFDVTQATLPNGTPVRFEKDGTDSKPVFHEEANTPTRVVQNSLPFVLVNAATTLPLNLATDLPGMPFGFAAKIGLGIAREFYRKDKDAARPVGHKVGYGILVGSGLTGVMFTLAEKPEPDLKPGDTVKLYLDPEGLENLFEVSSEGQVSTLFRQ